MNINKTLTQVSVLIIGLIILIPLVNYFNLKLENFKKNKDNTTPIEIPIVKPVLSMVKNIPYNH